MNAREYRPEDGVFLTQDSYRGEFTDVKTWGLRGYCAGDPINHTDPTGHDAILLHNRKGAFGAGHTGLLVQRKSTKKWYHWNWAAAELNSVGSKPADKNSLKRVGLLSNLSLSSINSLVKKKKVYSQTYTDMIRFPGNFSKSIDEMKRIKNTTKYNLTSNNCLQSSMNALKAGKFSKHNSEYKKAIGIASAKLTPNNAFTGILHFHKNIDKWKNKSKVSKLFSIFTGSNSDPYKYLL